MANATLESALDDDLASAPAETLLAPYAEEDDAATQLVEPPQSEPRWLVQLSPFDRRAMGTTELVTEVLGERLAAGTRVWRDGMRDWTPIEQLPELPAPRSSAPPASSRGSASLSPPSMPRPAADGPALVLATAGVAVVIAAATLAVLSAGGVFDSASAAAPDTAGAASRHGVPGARPARSAEPRLIAARADAPDPH